MTSGSRIVLLPPITNCINIINRILPLFCLTFWGHFISGRSNSFLPSALPASGICGTAIIFRCCSFSRFPCLLCFLWGKRENYRLPRWTNILYLPAAFLLLLVLTNDFHQLVFAFPADAAAWLDTDHTYGAGYFAVMGWIVLGMGAAILTMLLKCRIPRSRVILGLPFVPVGLAALYTALYVAGCGWLRDIAGDMTAVQCLLPGSRAASAAD